MRMMRPSRCARDSAWAKGGDDRGDDTPHLGGTPSWMVKTL